MAKKEETQEDIENLFTSKKDDDLKLHSSKNFGEKCKSKGVAFYQNDIDAINKLIEILQPHSKKQVKDSTVIRVAIHALLEAVQNNDKKTAKDLPRLIYENN